MSKEHCKRYLMPKEEQSAVKKNIRVVVKPAVPRIIPYQIPKETMELFLKENYSKFKSVLYLGWVRREFEGKKQLVFCAATGDTGLDARKAFKTSQKFGEDIWIIL